MSAATPTPPRKRRRRWIALALLGAAFVALTVPPLLLRSARVRQAILQGVSRQLAASTGWSLEADDWRLRLLSAELLVEGLVLRPPEGRPLLRAEAVAARLDRRILFGIRRLHHLAVTRPVVDLAALPTTAEETPQEGIAEIGWDLDRIEISEGEVRLPAPPGDWIDGARIRGLELEASVVDETLRATVTEATLALVGGRLGDRDLSVRGAVEGRLGGDLEISGVEVRGEGLELTADLDVGAEAQGPLGLRFTLEVAPGRLLQGTDGGALHAAGDLDLRRLTGHLRVSAEELPGELFVPWMPQADAARLALDGTRAAVAVDLSAPPGEGIRGSASWSWRRGETPLFDGTVQLLDGRLAEGEGTTAVTAAAELAASALPAEVFRPWVRPRAREALRGALLDLDGQVRFDRRADPTIEASATIRGLRGGETIFGARLRDGTAGLADGALDLASLGGELELRSSDLPLEILLAFVPEGETLGALEETLRGTGVAVEATLRGRPDSEGEVSGTGSLVWRSQGEPLLTASVLELTMPLGLSGSDAGSLDARIELALPGFATERLAPWIDAELFSRLRLGGARLAGEAALRWVDGRLDPAAAGAELRLLRDEQALAEARLQPLAGGSAVAVRLDLLPARPGVRRASGELVVASWLDLAGSRLRNGVVTLELADLAEEIEPLAAETAGLLPDALFAPAEAGDGTAQASAAGTLTPVDRLRGGLEAEVRVEGPLTALDAVLEAEWRPSGGGALRVAAEGTTAPLRGSADLTIEGLALAPLQLPGVVSGVVGLKVALEGAAEAWRASIDAEGSDLAFAAGPHLESLRLVARTDGGTFELQRLEARSDAATLGVAGALEASTRPSWIDLSVSFEAPRSGAAELDVELAEGTLRVESRALRTRVGEGRLRAVIPLDALAALPGIDPALVESFRSEPPSPRAPLPIDLDLHVPSLDSREVAAVLEAEESAARLVGEEIRLRLAIDARDPTASRGTLEVGAASLRTSEHTIVTEGPMAARLGERRLELQPIRATLDGRPLEVAGGAELGSWTGAWQDLVQRIELSVGGTVEMALLDPYLLGGVGNGPLRVDGSLAGPLDALTGRILLDGEGGRLDYLSPYVSRFEDPRVELVFAAGELRIPAAEATLNHGQLELTGAYGQTEGLVLDTTFRDVRYRLDYGLSTRLAGTLHLAFPPDGRSAITGELIVTDGLVRQNIDLQRQLLGRLFAPSDLTGSAASAASAIDLRVRLTTREGVRVRNNVADLRAVWSPLTIRGTLAEPIISGVIDVEPGGLLFAYGQVLRIDRATLTLPALAGVEPTLDLVTTTSLEDPSIKRRGSSLDPFAGGSSPTGDSRPTVSEGLTQGLTEYLGDRIAAGAGQLLSSPLAGTGITIRPVLAFNESDPDARLTVGRDLSEYLALAVSLNMREAESRTYLLHVHDLPVLPRMQAQVFTNEESNEGVTLQQTLELGSARESEEPELSAVRIEAPSGAELQIAPLRRAIGLAAGDRLPEGALFDAEVDLAEALRRQGYYGARVEVATRPGGRPDQVELVATVAPGPKTEVRFEGDPPPARLRSAIAGLYRSDYYERASLQEVAEQTRLALRAAGYLEPRVEVEVVEGEPRLLRIHAEGGRRVELGAPTFEGVGPEERAALLLRFASPAARVELAAGAAQADAAVRSTLRALGYPDAAVADRRIGPEGKRLTVRIELGPRQRIRHLSLEGVEPEMRERLAPKLTVAPGEPVRTARLAAAALAIEEELRREGYADARVRPAIAAIGADEVDVELRVEPGPRYRITDVEVEGLRATRPGWVKGVATAGSEPTLDTARLADVRRRLFETGVFSSVFIDTERRPDGEATLVVGAEERPRFTFAYGLRYESEEGLGAVVDVLDRNFLGRGIALGARGLYTEDREVGRVFASLPQIFGSRFDLDTFAEVRQELDEVAILFVDTMESSVQLSRSLGRRSTGRVYGRYRKETLREADPDPFFPFPTTVFRSPFVGLQLIHNRRTDPLAGRPGLFASADLSGSDDILGSDVRYVRFFGQLNLYRPAGTLAGRRLGWSQSYRLGLADGFGEPVERTLRFFAGGEFSVRGYSRESLGPFEPLGDRRRPLGGEALLVVNQELHVPIAGRFRGLLFFDAGNVWSTPGDIEADLRTSLGLGLRVDSPLGLLRLDIARPLSRLEGDSEVKVYLGLGQVF